MVAFLEEYFSKSDSLKGKKALVTAGPTYESIDPVRFIGNHSSGKMGYAVAEELGRRGAEVTLVSGPVHFTTPQNGIRLIPVQSAEEMFAACMDADGYDIAVMAAAVADYTPASVSDTKIKKKGGWAGSEFETNERYSGFPREDQIGGPGSGGFCPGNR